MPSIIHCDRMSLPVRDSAKDVALQVSQALENGNPFVWFVDRTSQEAGPVMLRTDRIIGIWPVVQREIDPIPEKAGQSQ